jgi:hypothetical protein
MPIGVFKRTAAHKAAVRAALIARNTTHGLRFNRFYEVWLAMKQRCYNQKNKQYKNYGGRGIRICCEWKNDPASFIHWCENQNPLPGHSLDRRDNNKSYSPANCRFVSNAIQARNRRMSIWVRINGEKLVLKDAVSKYGVVSYDCAKARVRMLGWSPKKAVLTPNRKNL